MADLRNAQYSVTIRDRMLDAMATRYADGYLRYYDGLQPASPAAAITTQTMLAELRFDNPAFPASAAAEISANPLAPDADAAADGDATWFRAFESDGVTAIVDGSIGLLGDGNDYNLTLDDIHIVQHALVSLTNFVIPMPQAGA